MNIYLIGYRCSGKTSLGKELAKRLGISFLDLDMEISINYSKSIFEIIDVYGWDFFRHKEKEVLEKISHRRKSIISTGGGVILCRKNILLMKKSGIIIWLQTRIDLAKKFILKGNKNCISRISLTGGGIIKDINTTFALRSRIYKKACDLSFSTENFDIDLICNSIVYCTSINFRK